MDYEGLIDDNRVLIACSMNYETAVTFTYGHFNKVVFAVHVHTVNTMHPSSSSQFYQASLRSKELEQTLV